jgi:hypothetical protein
MNSNHNATKEISIRDPIKAMADIKDTAIMLTFASDYLCETPFLKKLGLSIEHDLEIVGKHIRQLRNQFIGKPIREIDLQTEMDVLGQTAKLFLNAEEGLIQQCTAGELGSALAERYEVLSSKINALKEKVEGKSVAYTKSDSVRGIFGKFRFIMISLVATYKFATRFLGILMLVGLAAFIYLYITMEKEADILKEIERNKSMIQTNQTIYDQIGEELKEIKKRAKELDKKKLNRKQELELMELNLKVFKLNDDQGKAQVHIEQYQENNKRELNKLEKMKKKSFFERLTRQ